ncbi:carbamoyltransferase [Thermodesulfobacteriota bacterium]
MSEKILGISAYYHDSAAALLIDGDIIAAAHEERFTRKKHDQSFPVNAIRYVLSEADLCVGDLSAIAFYDKPYIKFERLLETYHAFAPKGLKSFLAAVPVWIKEKLFMKRMLWDELDNLSQDNSAARPPLYFPEHHLSHAASAFYPSPFENAAILTIDGVGEWATTTICSGEGNDITILKELPFPHSVGLLYSAFTYYCGFKVNSGEYKLMGLAPYGGYQNKDRVTKFKELILAHLVDLRRDGSILLNMEYFDYATGLRMCDDEKWKILFQLPRRAPESELTQPYMDMALAIQQVTEEIILRLASTAVNLAGTSNLVMAGGVALNCVANGKLLKSGIVADLWIQPAAGDAGGAVGAALAVHYIGTDHKRKRATSDGADHMHGAYLGPQFSDQDVARLCRKYEAPNICFSDFEELTGTVADILSSGQIVGWFQGRMEYGPRALGNRSILGDPRHPEMQKKLNLKIKYREGFRPFAPSVLVEDVNDYFDLQGPSPYMLLVAPVQEKRCNPPLDEKPGSPSPENVFQRLYYLRSDIPAVTHIDYSARIQTVARETNSRYWHLINTFKQKTGYGLLVNTSFNVRGEPIVCTPEDAYRCFMRTEMDCLVVGNHLFKKKEQPSWEEKENWAEVYELD